MITGGSVTMVNTGNNRVFARAIRQNRTNGSENGHAEQADDSTASLRDSTASIRRNLFGVVDHVELQQFQARHMLIVNLAEARKWNFDFVAGKPLAGDYDWKATVSPNAASPSNRTSNDESEISSVPSSRLSSAAAAALTREVLSRVDEDFLAVASAATLATATSDNSQVVAAVLDPAAESDPSESSSTSSLSSEDVTRQPSTSSGSRCTVQPNITDMFPSRKRSASPESNTDKMAASQRNAPEVKKSKTLP